MLLLSFQNVWIEVNSSSSFAASTSTDIADLVTTDDQIVLRSNQEFGTHKGNVWVLVSLTPVESQLLDSPLHPSSSTRKKRSMREQG